MSQSDTPHLDPLELEDIGIAAVLTDIEGTTSDISFVKNVLFPYAAEHLPAFVRVHRRVFMNLDWTMTTRVQRLAPNEGAFTLRLPLLVAMAQDYS